MSFDENGLKMDENGSIIVNTGEPFELACEAKNVEIKGCLFTNPEGKSFIIWDGAS